MSYRKSCDWCGKAGPSTKVGWNHPFTEYLHFHPECKALHAMWVEEVMGKLAGKNGWSPDARHSIRVDLAIKEAADAKAIEKDRQRQMNLF